LEQQNRDGEANQQHKNSSRIFRASYITRGNLLHDCVDIVAKERFPYLLVALDSSGYE